MQIWEFYIASAMSFAYRCGWTAAALPGSSLIPLTWAPPWLKQSRLNTRPRRWCWKEGTVLCGPMPMRAFQHFWPVSKTKIYYNWLIIRLWLMADKLKMSTSRRGHMRVLSFSHFHNWLLWKSLVYSWVKLNSDLDLSIQRLKASCS